MIEIIVLGALFVGSHFVLGAPSIRRQMVSVLGETGFLGVYSLVALVTLTLFVQNYVNQLSYNYWWGPAPQIYWITKLLMWFALVLVAGSFLAPNPSMHIVAGGMGPGSAGVTPIGVQRITRHPFLWGVGLWGIAHVVANGDAKSVVFFTWFFVLGALGAWILDWKKTQQLGDVWNQYCDQTSNVPFLALITGRIELSLRELAVPTAVGTLVYVLVYWAHKYIAGVALF